MGADGSINLNLKYFAHHYTDRRLFTRSFEDLFGKPRTREESGVLDPKYADIAASIQYVTEEILVAMAKYLRVLTDMKYLCMAGGVALNSLANYRILKEADFDGIYVQPAASDAGGALGAALWANHMVLGNPKSFTMTHAYWGPGQDAAQIGDFLRESNITFEEANDQEHLIERVVDALRQEKVVGWYQDKTEWGPRALGNRSILASPCDPGMKDVVNKRIKFREAFRPFAPSVLAESAQEYFDLPEAEAQWPARFMLYVAPVFENQQDKIPAVTHVDGTARLQAVHQSATPLYHNLISTWGESSGVPVVLNTSFNRRGDPIVNRPEEAYQTFSNSDLDLLVMDRFLCYK